MEKISSEKLKRIKKKRELIINTLANCPEPQTERQKILDELIKEYTRVLLKATDRIISENGRTK